MKYFVIIITDTSQAIYAYDNEKAAGEKYHSELAYANNQNLTELALIMDENGVVLPGKREKVERILPKYTVTYHSEHGTEPAPQFVVEGNLVPFIPGAGEEEGWMFLGWVDANDVGFDFTAPIMSNVDIYAKWEAIPEPEPEVESDAADPEPKIEPEVAEEE